MPDNQEDTLTRSQVLGMIKDHLERNLKPIQEGIQSLQSQQPPNKATHSEPESETNLQLAEVIKQNKLLEKRFKEQDERERATNLELTLNKELEANGFAHREHAKAFLKGAGLVKMNEKGDVRMIAEDGADLPFNQGIKEWAKSEGAKLYMAPKNTSGSGTQSSRSVQQSQNRSNNMSVEEVDKANDQALDQSILQYFGKK